MKIAIIGYGKMGKAIEGLTEGHEQVVLRITAENRQELTKGYLQQADVAIEFTQPEAAFDNIALCLRAGVPIVSGTTGWLDRRSEMEQLIRQTGGALFYASNFSIGVNLFFALSRQLAQWMNAQSGYEVDIREVHHTEKKDAPSGTAITLAEGIAEQLDRKKGWRCVEENAGNSTASGSEADKITIFSERKPEVFGIHEIRWDSPVDRIQLEHQAHSREGFARGALEAARWIRGKQGWLGMEDMLSF